MGFEDAGDGLNSIAGMAHDYSSTCREVTFRNGRQRGNDPIQLGSSWVWRRKLTPLRRLPHPYFQVGRQELVGKDKEVSEMLMHGYDHG